MKKVFGQTVRDLKREVNKKVLKVPGIEQKVLDATSNETWGPHGTLLADIATASRNYHEYQKIMAVVWKRINDHGKNWRHVYKALIVLEYLVANGSERVIDEIREHAHQISTLADFQYIDSNGRDQGINVRRKSQSLVMLLNDKEQIVEVRQKAAANRDKFHNSPGSGMYKSGGYDEDRYSSRDEYGYGRDREGGYRDDDRNSRNGDSYSRDGDRYSRDSEERYGRDGYREDDYRDNQNGPRSKSVDRDGNHSAGDDGQYSARGMHRELSDQSIGGPPSYEEAVGESRSPAQSERDQKTSSPSVPKPSSPTLSNNASPTGNAPGPSPPPANQGIEAFDEFDPRHSVPGVETSASASVNEIGEVDLLGSLSDSFLPNPSSTRTNPAQPTEPATDAFAANNGFGTSDVMQQPFDDPFGEAPFRALPSNDNSAPFQHSVDTSVPSFPPSTHQQAAAVPDFGYGDTFPALTYGPPDSSQFPSHDIANPEEEIDILAGILPPSGPSPVTAAQTPFSAPGEQHLQLATTPYGDFGSQGGTSTATSQAPSHADMQYNHGNFHQTLGTPASPFSDSSSQADAGVYGDFGSQSGVTTSVTQQMTHQAQTGADLHPNQGYSQHQTGHTASPFSAQSGQPAQSSGNIYGDFGLQAGPAAPITSQQLSSKSQAGTDGQFNPGNFQHQMGPSASPFSAPSQNGQAMQLKNGDFGSQAGPAPAATSQLSPQAPSGMNVPFNHGNFQQQPGPSASPFSAQTQNGQAIQPNNGDFGSQAGSTAAVTSQVPPHAPSGMNMPFNQGNFQQQAGPSASPFSSHSQNGQVVQFNNGDFSSQAGPTATVASQIPPQARAGMNMPFTNGNFQNRAGPSASSPYSAPQTQNGQVMQPNGGSPFSQYASTPFTSGNFGPPGGSSAGSFSHNMTPQTANGSTGLLNGSNNFLQHQVSGPPAATQHAPSTNGGMLPQSEQQQAHMNSQPTASSLVGPLAIVPQKQSQDKFQTKSTVWADTLSRGLVDLNISGSKTNPLADIGVDFDSINRKDKRMEKQPATPVTSTITMGKAMGSGTGMGRAGAGSLRPSPNPMAGNMGMGMGGMGMVGGHGPGMGMGMGMGMGGGQMGGMGMGGGQMGGMGMGGGQMGGMGMGGGQMGGMGMGMGGMGGGYGGMNQQQMGMGMGMGMGMNPGYNNMGMGMNPGMAQGGAPMQQPGNGYGNPMMGGTGYPQQPYGGGYR